LSTLNKWRSALEAAEVEFIDDDDGTGAWSRASKLSEEKTNLADVAIDFLAALAAMRPARSPIDPVNLDPNRISDCCDPPILIVLRRFGVH